jgi:ring-1,2-phenylacetyl-CoA epoxidase subunit PaaE
MNTYQRLLKIKNVVRETIDAVTIYFDDAEQKINYKPGQFLTLTKEVEGKRVSRTYSICTSPYVDNHLAITVKKVPNGLMSTYLVEHIQRGDVVEVSGPNGNFTTEVNPGNKRNIILFGGGSGITPLISLARSVLHEEPESKVSLIYANRNVDSIIFKNLLLDMQNAWKERFWVLHTVEILECLPFNEMRKGFSFLPGRLNAELIEEIIAYCPDLNVFNSEYFICGPESMMSLVSTTLEKMGISSAKIFSESFTPPIEENKVVLKMKATQSVKVINGGITHEIQVPRGKSILEAALDQGVELPHSCKGALCGSCQGTLLSGKVKLDKNYSLTDEELATGQVLTCVSKPLTADIVIKIS